MVLSFCFLIFNSRINEKNYIIVLSLSLMGFAHAQEKEKALMK